MSAPSPTPRALAGPSWPTRRDWSAAVLLVLATRLVLLAVAWGAAWLLADTRGHLTRGPLAIWRRWDADLFLKIAEGGYAGSDPYSEAFLPGLPLAIRAVASVGIDPLVAGMLLTTVATVVATAYLVRLAEQDVGVGAGVRAGLYLLVFPTAAFLVASYSEAPFLAGAIAAFHHARRGEWRRVAPFAALAAATRVAGLFVLAGLAVEFLRRGRLREWRAAAAALVVGALPLLAYLAWLWRVHGTPLYLLTAQREGWGRTFVGPFDALSTTLSTWGGDYSTGLYLTWQLEVGAALVGVLTVALLVLRREWGYATFTGGLLAVLLVSTWYYSIPRVLLTFFPIPLLLAGWTARHPRRHDLVLVGSAAAATVGVVVFTQGRWFF